MQPVDINSLTIEQAKAMAYDELCKIEIAQKNIQVLNQVIAQKSQTPRIEETEQAVS